MASSPEPDFETTEIDEDMFPESSVDAPAPSTPRQTTSHLPPVTELSPPNSQSRRVATGAGNARAQAALDILGGIGGVLNGAAESTSNLPGTGVFQSTASSAAGPVKVHEATGYQWIRPEDEPGYAWKNRKAQEEAMKALDQIAEKEKMVGARYGDILMEQQIAEKS